jgi:hypothetical protein
MAISIKGLIEALCINENQHNDTEHLVLYYRLPDTFVIPGVIMLSVIMLSVVMLSFIMLSVVMLSVAVSTPD